jgi:endoglucanase
MLSSPISAVVISLAFLGHSITSGQTVNDGKIHRWWNERPAGRPANNPNAKKLPLIAVRGNKFVDPQGNPVLFRGVSIADPDKISAQGHWNKDLFARVGQMGARLVRIPVHPVAWRERSPREYLVMLDQAVDWCTDLGIYVDIDWHSIGNLQTGLFQDPMYDTSMQETFNFWRTVAMHFAGNHTVAFYELFNEPTTFSNKLGPVSWDDWKRTNESLIAVIRAHDPEKIPLVAGFDWAYDLTPLHLSPIAAEGIGYVTHPYPMKRPRPWESKWEEDFGFAADRYPVLATEIGFEGKAGTLENGYGPTIIKYLEGKGIGWIAWAFDPEWGPRLIGSWDTFAFTDSGEFFHQAMSGKTR